MKIFSKKKTKKTEIMDTGADIIRKYSRDKYGYFSKDIVELFHNYMDRFNDEGEFIQEEITTISHLYVGDAAYEALSSREICRSEGVQGIKAEAVYVVWNRCMNWRREKGLITKEDFEMMVSELEQEMDYV
ncbi:hypothetical protein [Parasporobacterium paucivorans]|uniref:Uncharacterized protein n=1 Tax=Parasporobacterium paucivorans DSM 15970 TaxID=1122934 RepID=A0A1M6GNV7_9FIRM|nr:hypothetical protein [Parasporobacterium paucivorans]SHJ11588.1 hypothetical protein SAMN02745691_01375 [Parasporobacterium paucivorans DSM 15970]